MYPNYYSTNNLFQLEIFESTSNPSFLEFIGSGSCDNFGGMLSANENSLNFTVINTTLLGPCPPNPAVTFEQLYHPIFINEVLPFTFSYVINGINNDQTLTLTNPNTGSKIEYGRTPNPETLTRTWYLSRIEIPGNPTIEIQSTESPSLTLTNDLNSITFKNITFGDGDCNSFFSDYEVTLTNGNSIQLLDFTPTLAFCESEYESQYFSIIGNFSTNFSEFEIVNNGTTLNVIDLLGVRLVFGDEPLSVSENQLNTLQISLKNNPVDSHLYLRINQSVSELLYQIYSINGKLIDQAFLGYDTIDVEGLNSGLYFIRFSNEAYQTHTIRFIKN